MVNPLSQPARATPQNQEGSRPCPSPSATPPTSQIRARTHLHRPALGKSRNFPREIKESPADHAVGLESPSQKKKTLPKKSYECQISLMPGKTTRGVDARSQASLQRTLKEVLAAGWTSCRGWELGLVPASTRRRPRHRR